MDEIRIPNDATYAPVALTDLITTAPLATRLILGATLPGREIQLGPPDHSPVKRRDALEALVA